MRIRGIMPLTNGSGSCYFRHWPSRCQTKTNFLKTFFCYYFSKAHLHHFSKIKSQKESQNSRNQGFYNYFCMMIEGSGSGSIPLTNGSGSGRSKNMWIRIRIRNTDLQYCIFQNNVKLSSVPFLNAVRRRLYWRTRENWRARSRDSSRQVKALLSVLWCKNSTKRFTVTFLPCITLLPMSRSAFSWIVPSYSYIIAFVSCLLL